MFSPGTLTHSTQRSKTGSVLRERFPFSNGQPSLPIQSWFGVPTSGMEFIEVTTKTPHKSDYHYLLLHLLIKKGKFLLQTIGLPHSIVTFHILVMQSARLLILILYYIGLTQTMGTCQMRNGCSTHLAILSGLIQVYTLDTYLHYLCKYWLSYCGFTTYQHQLICTRVMT